MNPGDIILPINRAIFPASWCGGAQEIGDFIAQNMQVVLPGSISFFVTQSNEPTVEQHSLTWQKTDPSTGVIIGEFRWSPVFGVWLKNHWSTGVPPFAERKIFTGSLNDLALFDGGENSTVSDTTGPFWVEDSAFADKSLLGVGAAIPLPLVTAPEFVTGANDPKFIGVRFIKASGRLYDRGS